MARNRGWTARVYHGIMVECWREIALPRQQSAMELPSHIASTKALFAQHFGGDCTVVVAAPGRVNLIGEHTDYNEVRGLPPCARHQRCNVAA